MRKQLQEYLESRVQQYVGDARTVNNPCEKAKLKKAACSKRNAEIVKAKGTGEILSSSTGTEFSNVFYRVHLQFLIKQRDFIYLEEEIEYRKAKFYKEVLVEDAPVPLPTGLDTVMPLEVNNTYERNSYEYDRLKAVQYAERWWNDYNPAYKKFVNDCTSFISQCLHAGGAPMRGYPGRGNGWWMRGENYSYSWAMANSLRQYLATSKSGLRAREVGSPDQLLLGDVICYDFQGDGRFDHNTMVTGKDANGMPLVNAHTYNSRLRYWKYEDSTAYTPNIKYKFFTITDGA